MQNSGSLVPDDIACLAYGPQLVAKAFNGYAINGYRFRTTSQEQGRKSQNSGIAVTAMTTSYASSRDRIPVAGDVTYYGRITNIIQLMYSETLKFVLFRCDWVDVRAQGRGIKYDDHGCTLVNFTRLLPDHSVAHEPYVMATQAEQVFYVQDPIEHDWHVVLKIKPRDLYEMNADMIVDEDAFRENIPFVDQHLDASEHDDDEGGDWVRVGITGATVDAPPPIRQRRTPSTDFDHADIGLDDESDDND